MKRVNCDSKPLAIEAVGNGSYLYRWDIEQVATTDPETEDERTSWDCYEVKVGKTPTANNITQAVVDAMWGDGVEQKLMNDYNAYKEGILTDATEYEQPYLDFLAERKALKEQIESDVSKF